MIGRIFGVMSIFSIVCALFTGNIHLLANSIISGASAAVDLCLGLLGMMCLWSGVASVLDSIGFTKALAFIIKPFLKFAYPDAYKKSTATDDIAADFSANLLGLGNAALPLGIKAMKSLCKDTTDIASDDMVMFCVLNTTPIQLMPATLIALRSSAGSLSPFDVILPIWICSVVTTLFAVIVCKLLAKIF